MARTVRQFQNRFSDPLIAGAQTRAGAAGTFNRNLLKVGARANVSRVFRGGNVVGPKPMKRHRKKQSDHVHFGAVNGDFSTMGLVAVAAVLVVGYLIIKK